MAIGNKIISFWKRVKLKSSDMFTLFRVGVGVKAPTHKLHVKDKTDPLKVEGLQNDTTDPDKYLTIDSNNIVKYRTGTEVASDIGVVSSFVLEDGDGTEVTVTNGSEIKFVETAGIDIDWTDVSDGSDSDPYDLTFTINPAQTTITSLFATDIKIGEDDETKVDFETANEIHFDCNNVEVLSLAETEISINTSSFTIESSVLGDPEIRIKNTTNAPHGSASIVFDKDRGAAAEDGQVIGVIMFHAEDSNEESQNYARIMGTIEESGATNEGGQLEFEVASHDGELVCGLKLVDGDAEDEVDVTIANTTTSLTTIAGDVQVNGNDIKDDDGVSCITFDSSGNTTVANTLNATLTGNVTGNVSGSSGSATGNAATATALETGRTINGVSFNGTANITVTAAGSTLSDTVTVAKGGTGLTSIAADTILTGNGTGALISEAYFTYSSSGEELCIGNPDGGDAIVSRRDVSGTDTAGGNLVIAAGAATGNAAGGAIEFKSSVAGSSGASVQSLTEIATISKEGNLSIDGDLTVGGGDIYGATDGDLTISSDGSMTFILDDDNDETSQSFSFKNDTTEVANLDESGNLQCDGVITGKQRWILNCGFSGSTTAAMYMPFGNGGIVELSSTSGNLEYVGVIAPADGYVEYVVMRSENVCGSSTVGIHVAAAGTEVPSASMGSFVSPAVDMAVDDTAYKFTGFVNAGGTTNSFSAGDVIVIGFDPTNDADDTVSTAVLVLDWNNPLS